MISGRKRLHTYAEGTFMPEDAKDCLTFREICRDTLTTVGDCKWPLPFVGLSSRKTLQADGAPPDDFRGLTEVNFRFTVAHADRGLFAVRNEGYLRRPAEGPLR